jgi:hypothetical protein
MVSPVEQRPQRVHVLYFDSEVNKVETYEGGQPVRSIPWAAEGQTLALASTGWRSMGFDLRLWSF